MSAPPATRRRRRARRGSLDRPISGRTYRGTWLLVAFPLLLAAFTVVRPAALPRPDLPAAFDRPGIEKLFDNERVTIWRYTWQPHKKTPRHFHANDVVVVHLADGVLASTTPDGKTVMNPNSFALTKFNPRGRIHEEELVKGKASAIIVELK